MFDYSREPVNDYFLIDMKSFYASVECIERNLDPMTTPLIVMSRSDNTGSGLTLASSPTAKKNIILLMLVELLIYLIHYQKNFILFHHE